MENIVEISAPAGGNPAECSFDLGRWLGRREAFGVVSGRCSAADIECLRRIRNEKMYLQKAANWDEFCTRELKASRRKIDGSIRHLDEFGPAFFQLAQLTRITPEAYRAIAPQIAGNGIQLDNEIIALLPENTEKIGAAVAELRRRAAPPGSTDDPKFQRLQKRLELARATLRDTKRLEPRQKDALLHTLRGIQNASARLGIDV